MAGELVIDFHTAQLEHRGGSLFFRFANEDQKVIQSGEFGKGVIPREKPVVSHGEDFTSITFTWTHLASLTIHYVQHPTGVEYRVEWSASSRQLVDAFLMPGSHWYGAAQIRNQHWPIEKWVRPEMAFVAGDSFKDQYGGVQERYWLSSRGFAICVNQDVPLFVSMNNKNDQSLTLISKWASPYKNIEGEPVKLSYRLFVGLDVRTVHDLAMGVMFCKPNGIPDELIFRHPIWSTWARYKHDINQDKVLEFAREIKENGFKAAQVEIDDDWTPHYGDMEFSPKKFPNPEAMMGELTNLGFRVTVWVHPFCSPFSAAASHPYWIKSGLLPGHTTWWNGIGKILDVTKPEATEWFKKSLQDLKEKYKLTSFKFDAGEVNWLPNMAKPEKPWKNPNTYTTKYAELCYECDPETRAQEVRVALQTQHLPMFVRMMDKDSNWGYNNGLKSLIPHALTFSVLGYPFILPDMIGGNAYSSSGNIGSSSEIPDKELFIRWLQANVFLPALQFSIAPWQYDEETIKICKAMTRLHEKYADTMIELAKESVQTGAPIVRPLWWVAPCDTKAQSIDDEFLLGDDILVAPVLVRGSESRDVYLPPGMWHDELRKTILEGGKWYCDYEAKLSELPHFIRHEEKVETPSGDEFRLVEEEQGEQEEQQPEVEELIEAAADGDDVISCVPELVSEEEVQKMIGSEECVEEMASLALENNSELQL